MRPKCSHLLALAGAAVLAALLGLGQAARAADLPGAAPSWLPGNEVLDPANRFEARFGVFAHGVGGAEQNTVSLNGEVVTPRLFYATGSWWAYFVPRFHAGGFVNLAGRTSSAYVGMLWTFPVFDRWFIEGFIGPAVHNGSLTPTPTHAGLGCPVLFNLGASVGYHLTDRWSVMGTVNHMSNGRGVLGVNCGTNQGPGGNQGLTHYGVRASYAF